MAQGRHTDQYQTSRGEKSNNGLHSSASVGNGMLIYSNVIKTENCRWWNYTKAHKMLKFGKRRLIAETSCWLQR